MTIFDDIKRDREAGTPGDWDKSGSHRMETEFGVYADSGRSICSTGGYYDGLDQTHGQNVSNARRIARVPQLEAIALAAEELAEVAERLANHNYDEAVFDAIQKLWEACK